MFQSNIRRSHYTGLHQGDNVSPETHVFLFPLKATLQANKSKLRKFFEGVRWEYAYN